MKCESRLLAYSGWLTEVGRKRRCAYDGCRLLAEVSVPNANVEDVRRERLMPIQERATQRARLSDSSVISSCTLLSDSVYTARYFSQQCSTGECSTAVRTADPQQHTIRRGIQSSVKKYMYSGTNVHRVYLNSQQSYTSAQLYVPPHSIHNTKTYQIPCSYDNIQIVGRLSTVNRTGITMRIVLLLTLSM